MTELSRQVVAAALNGSIGAAIVGIAVLVVGWYRREATDAEEFYGGRLDKLQSDFDSYTARTDAELQRHRRDLDRCRTRETELMAVEHELRLKVASLRRDLDKLNRRNPE